MNLGRAVLNSGSWKKIWTNYPNWIYTVKIFYHDVTFSRFAVGRNTLPKLGLKLTISWKSSLKGPDLQQSMIKGQFTKNGTFINILAILRPIWPQLCMLNKSASHLRTSFLVLVTSPLISESLKLCNRMFKCTPLLRFYVCKVISYVSILHVTFKNCYIKFMK